MWGLSSDVKIQKLFSSRLVTHTGEKTHQIKAGWILDEENNVKMSRPKGENFIIFITWHFVKSIDSASRSVMLADGRPFESFKTAQCTAMHEVSTFWKTFRFLEVSEWLVPASSFGFFCPLRSEDRVPWDRLMTSFAKTATETALSLSHFLTSYAIDTGVTSTSFRFPSFLPVSPTSGTVNSV